MLRIYGSFKMDFVNNFFSVCVNVFDQFSFYETTICSIEKLRDVVHMYVKFLWDNAVDLGRLYARQEIYDKNAWSLGRWYNDITGQSFCGLESAKWNIREPRDLTFYGCSINETNAGRNSRSFADVFLYRTNHRMLLLHVITL